MTKNEPLFSTGRSTRGAQRSFPVSGLSTYPLAYGYSYFLYIYFDLLL